MKNRLFLASAAMAMISFGSAQAQTILNGSFEQKSATKPTDGGLFDWDHSGNVVVDTTYTGGGNISLGSAINPYAGNHFAVMTPDGDGNAVLSQTLLSGPGSSFSVSFALDFALFFDGSSKATGLSSDTVFEVFDVTTGKSLYSVALNSLFTAPVFPAAAGSSSSGWELENSPDISGVGAGNEIEFEFLMDSADLKHYAAALAVDDVSLTPTVSVPDGGFSLALLGLSASLLGIGRRLFARER